MACAIPLVVLWSRAGCSAQEASRQPAQLAAGSGGVANPGQISSGGANPATGNPSGGTAQSGGRSSTMGASTTGGTASGSGSAVGGAATTGAGGGAALGSGGAAALKDPALWWDAAWSMRRKVLVDNAAITEALTTLPLLVKLSASMFASATVGAQGQDLRLIDAVTGQPLAFEIASWDPAGTSYVWVTLPNVGLPPAAPGFWLYFGNPQATALPKAAANNPWAAPFSGVWHLDGGMLDSSPNSYDGITMVGGRWQTG